MKILVSKPHAPPAAFLPFLHAFLSWLCFGLLAVGRAELASGFWLLGSAVSLAVPELSVIRRVLVAAPPLQ